MSEQEQFAEPFKRIDAQQAKELIDRGEVNVIDVREDWEYANGHIPNAKHIPLAKIINAAQQHVQDDNVIFVCEVGQRSAVAAEFAAALGKQNLYNLEGGTTAWRQSGYPVEK
jgi:rhodanese-related sulfurtransferase